MSFRRVRMAAGYSKRSLVEKLGIKEGYRIAIINPPANYSVTLGPLPKEITARKRPQAPLDFIQFFCVERAELERSLAVLKKALTPNGMFWVSWPKGTSKTKTDLCENAVREIGIKNGLVDVKVCAVDETWSGLKFVYRAKDRE